MLNIVLFEPEIPPNTGNIIRLCANMGAQLHLVEPLGFELDDKKLRRAGLDYGEWANVQRHANWQALLAVAPLTRMFALTTKGKRSPSEQRFEPGDWLVFGPESRGLPPEIRGQFPSDNLLRIPMVPESRSLNLSNAVAIVAYEAWRQLGFTGAQ